MPLRRARSWIRLIRKGNSMNIFKQPDLKSAANALNAVAPEGERLAYVNEAEEAMLKAAGGAGESVNESGVPSFFPWGAAAIGAGALLGSSKKGPSQPDAPNYFDQLRQVEQFQDEYYPAQRQRYIDAMLGTGEYEGLGDYDLSEAAAAEQLRLQEEFGPQFADALIKYRQQYDPRFAELESQRRMAVDPTGEQLRIQTQQDLLNRRGAEEIADTVSYEEMGEAPTMADTGLTAEGRALLEQQIFDDVALDDRFSSGQEAQLQQELLGQRLAGGGSALGSGAAVKMTEEKLAERLGLGQRRKEMGLGLLASGQSTSDTANRMQQQNFANTMNRLNQINQARQVGSGQRIAARLADQQMAQSASGLGARGAAAPFQGPQILQGPQQQNLGAGAAQFAGNVYGQEMGAYNAAMNRPGFGSMLGGIAGQFAGTDKGAGMIGDFFNWKGPFGGGGATGNAGPT